MPQKVEISEMRMIFDCLKLDITRNSIFYGGLKLFNGNASKLADKILNR